jgi:hypothetical protein
MNELTWIYGTAALMIGTFLVQVVTRKFDPFAPIWLFFVGYLQIYIVQAFSYHEWAVEVRGEEIVEGANFRSFWALGLMLGVYFLVPVRLVTNLLPRPPERWSHGLIQMVCPFLVLWGLLCSGVLQGSSGDSNGVSPEVSLLTSFPMVMLVAGVILIVTGRQPLAPRPALTGAGVAIVAAYMVIWMFNGKRSHSLIAVLTGVCSFYLPRLKRPSFPVLFLTAIMGSLAVGISIGWRYYSSANSSNSSFSKFVDFVTNFDPETILESINLKDRDNSSLIKVSHETEEYGGFLLMFSVVPEAADYDYGVNYLRIFSTYIPRLIWAEKPLFGRDQWVAAWIAGSELKRDSTFTGPSIGILGATQLNGGAWGTAIVFVILGLCLRIGYDYFRRYADVPWVQVWWTTIFFNSWLTTVGDDPLTWFYYNYGFTTLPLMVLFFVVNKSGSRD